ncbi:hypothetical protein PI124_g18668 [Phytophthora idaei]|nr:hypothetical protein PI125_g19524 [Phytophthora idaei]KAG3133192.1 hypothetical protein PI126_g19281 [Phytophthora idaei]KAG3236322.1 hypothetical protein PI124_g18668 [Phytophthora idaei]
MPRYAQVARMTVGDNQAVLRVAKTAVDLSAPPAVAHQLQTAVEPAVQSPTEHFAPASAQEDSDPDSLAADCQAADVSGVQISPDVSPAEVQDIPRPVAAQPALVHGVQVAVRRRSTRLAGAVHGGKRLMLGDEPRRPAKRRRQRRAAKAAGKWKAAFIKDNVTTATGNVLCRVLWKTRRHGRLPRTWESRDMLLEDGFEETLNVVDEWHEAGRKQDFAQFVSELYPSVAGANSAGHACSLHCSKP